LDWQSAQAAPFAGDADFEEALELSETAVGENPSLYQKIETTCQFGKSFVISQQERTRIERL